MRGLRGGAGGRAGAGAALRGFVALRRADVDGVDEWTQVPVRLPVDTTSPRPSSSLMLHRLRPRPALTCSVAVG